MPQSTKDNKGGKTTASKKTHSKGAASDAKVKEAAGRAGNSPTGPVRHGEKKTTR